MDLPRSIPSSILQLRCRALSEELGKEPTGHPGLHEERVVAQGSHRDECFCHTTSDRFFTTVRTQQFHYSFACPLEKSDFAIAPEWKKRSWNLSSPSTRRISLNAKKGTKVQNITRVRPRRSTMRISWNASAIFSPCRSPLTASSTM